MKVEVINDHAEVSKEMGVCYWVATVLNVENSMMLLHYAGSEDETSQFWFDIRSKHLHPVGWCYRARRPLAPPAGLVFFVFFNIASCTFSVHQSLPILTVQAIETAIRPVKFYL